MEERRERLDKALVMRGLCASRARAQALITGGKVLIGGKVIVETDQLVESGDRIELAESDIRWVSRAGLKLEHAIDHWKIDPGNMTVLDIGASTGGFTDVVLSRGAKKVYALDVGHGQLSEKLRNDPRVVNMERMHIKDVSREDFPDPIDLIVIDVSFISLKNVLPKAKELLSERGEIVALVKPQFEVGKDAINKGIVKDPALHERVLSEITSFAATLGFAVSEPVASPVLGGDGNREFLLYLKQK